MMAKRNRHDPLYLLYVSVRPTLFLPVCAPESPGELLLKMSNLKEMAHLSAFGETRETKRKITNQIALVHTWTHNIKRLSEKPRPWERPETHTKRQATQHGWLT